MQAHQANPPFRFSVPGAWGGELRHLPDGLDQSTALTPLAALVAAVKGAGLTRKRAIRPARRGRRIAWESADGSKEMQWPSSVDVLWTPEEDAARDAEEAAAAEAKAADAAATQARAEARAVAVAKLQQLGISEADLAAILS